MSFEVTLSIEPEHESVRGHFATGGDAADRELEDSLIARLDAGDLWAWCTVCVTVRCGEIEESTYLGGCSFTDEADFRASGYLDDMVHECEERLLVEAMRMRDAARYVLDAFDARAKAEASQ